MNTLPDSSKASLSTTRFATGKEERSKGYGQSPHQWVLEPVPALPSACGVAGGLQSLSSLPLLGNSHWGRLCREADLGSSLSCVSLTTDLTPQSLGFLIYKRGPAVEPTSEGCLVG